MAKIVQDYASELGNSLAKYFISEQRSFLKCFVDMIEVDDSEVKMYYTIPMPSVVYQKELYLFYLSQTTAEEKVIGSTGREG